MAKKNSTAGFPSGWRLALLVGAVLMLSAHVMAELTQVEVGGEIRIRGRYYINTWDTTPQKRIADNLLPWRPIGPTGTASLFKWDSRGKDWTRYETALLLNFKADFTDNVSTFIEFYDFHIWGEEFRSNYLTGADNRAANVDDVLLNQGYIEMRNVFNQPLRVRLGRQNLLFGKGWLMSDMLTPSQYISFDALRLTYAANDFTIDGFASRIPEPRNVARDDLNTYLYGLHGVYSGFAPLSIALYWFMVQDNTDIDRFEQTQLGRWFNKRMGYDYSSTTMHTIGTRLNGKYEGFDYDLELAYQFGDAAHLGSLFKPIGSQFGDTGAKYDNWAVDAVLGYTFRDVAWQPRLYAQGVLFSGEDNRDINFWQWLNPFYRPEASVSFNRLFTDKNYMPTVNDNSWLSNFYQLSAGLELQPTEKIRLHAHVAKNWVHKPFNPPKSVSFGGRRRYVAPMLSFWTDEADNDIGWEVTAWMRYSYSQDLWFMLYGNYLWTGSGLAKGSFIHFYGTQFSGGTADKNAGYLFWMAVLKF